MHSACCTVLPPPYTPALLPCIFAPLTLKTCEKLLCVQDFFSFSCNFELLLPQLHVDCSLCGRQQSTVGGDRYLLKTSPLQHAQHLLAINKLCLLCSALSVSLFVMFMNENSHLNWCPINCNHTRLHR